MRNAALVCFLILIPCLNIKMAGKGRSLPAK